MGISGGERRVAKKVGVDPYTSNPELTAEINRVAKYDRIGMLGLGFANIPSGPEMGYIKDLNHYVWDKDPKELRDFNKKNLLEMVIDDELVEKFLDSPYYSPRFQTTIVFHCYRYQKSLTERRSLKMLLWLHLFRDPNSL